jgi:hypothetical protein
VTLYRVGTTYAAKRLLAPRLAQFARRARCILDGHQWSSWMIDDYDGPCEPLPGGGVMPLLARESRPGEFGTRACQRHCGAVQIRHPAKLEQAPGRLQSRDD